MNALAAAGWKALFFLAARVLIATCPPLKYKDSLDLDISRLL